MRIVFDILDRQGRGVTLKTDKPDDVRDFQHLEPIAQSKPDEDVAGEKGELQPHSTVLPTAHTFVEREETLHRSPLELLRDALLVVRAGIRCVLVRLEIFNTRSRAQWQSGFGFLDCECPREDGGLHQLYSASPRHSQGNM